MYLRRLGAVTAAMLVMGWVGGVRAQEPTAVFKDHCAKCHGETGQADTPAGKMLKAPKLADNAKVAGMAVADLVKAVKENEKHKAVLKNLSDEQIQAASTAAKALAEAK
jgi:mono/diheme cytochrome c family protein